MAKTTQGTKVTTAATVDNLTIDVDLQGLATISKAVKESMANITGDQLRFLVDSYYQTQQYRKTVENQIRAVQQGFDGEGAEAPLALDWIAKNIRNQENQIKKMLDEYTDHSPVGQWAKDTIGIGPVIAAGLIGQLDISKVKYANQFFSYCGCNNNNSPWLGVEKAKELVSTLRAYTKFKMQVFESVLGNNLGTVSKLASELAKLYDPKSFNAKVYTPYLSGSANDEEEGTTILNQIMSLLGDEFRELLEYSSDEWVVTNMGEKYDPFKLYVLDAENSSILKQQYVKYRRQKKMEDADVYDTPVKDIFLEFLMSKENKDGSRELSDYVSDNLVYLISVATFRSVRTINTLIKDDTKVSNLCKQLAKPPYNTTLSQLCWIIGDSFIKRSGNEASLYGRIYRERKAYETERNNRGCYAEQAQMQLDSVKYGKDTITYKALSQGKLSDGQINDRARRYAVKLFISHLYEAMYLDYYKEQPPIYYTLAKDPEHNKYIGPEVPFDRYIKWNK